MLCNLWVASALCAVALSAPTIPYSSAAAERPTEMKVLSEYFNMLGSKVQAGKQMAEAPVCDLSNAVLPTASPTALPKPSEGLVLKHVAIGRGTQNYSCSTGNATAPPAAVGALATLYNASCVASTYPDLLNLLPSVALQFNLSSVSQASLTPSNLAISGHHLFTNTTTPFFTLNTDAMQLGVAPCAKNNSVSAPTSAVKGQYDQGFGAVAWLKLTARSGATGNLEEVYRVNTAGGNPPATCAGMPATFEVQYAAEYWFYESA
ncbi:hypothetical protein LSUB1_G001018 [Lachnellula subtilissima]|uniref:Malate dehydrogenase n=1 Tax=Lachnellula subtilissima TaxID=602034 RepID=A0A8H8UEW4_9HELO|nr:hypothetical protein LSUB1_G001018 [Lachnellula subtilissima]